MSGLIDGHNIEDNSIPSSKIIGGGGLPATNVTYTLTGGAKSNPIAVSLGDDVTIPTTINYTDIDGIPSGPKLGDGINMVTPNFDKYAAYIHGVSCKQSEIGTTEKVINDIPIDVSINSRNKYVIGLSPSVYLQEAYYPNEISNIESLTAGSVNLEDCVGIKRLENTIWLYSSPELLKMFYFGELGATAGYDETYYTDNTESTICGYRNNIAGVDNYYDASGNLLGTDDAAKDAAITFWVQAKHTTSHIYGAPFTGMFNSVTGLVSENDSLPAIPAMEFDLTYDKVGTSTIWGHIKIEVTNDSGVFKYKITISRKGETLSETLTGTSSGNTFWSNCLNLGVLVYDLSTGEFI